MSSLDIRSNSAVMKRAEQLKRWEESETNRASDLPRPENGRKIKFSSGCVFLAACLAGDKEEVIKLLQNGANINTANVDGLTALHQACIDDNLDMVEFLVENGADINRQDNEGWTPLHATASCGFVSIARYLVDNGADIAAVNSDGDLALDLAIDIQQMPMIEYMQKIVNEHQIDCTQARQAEETMMLNDAKKWLRSDASEVNRPHPKTGATALHVAAAKGYTKVLSLLLAGRANVDKQDNDGWTPLHAAAHWSQKAAAEMLVDAMADMDVRNYAGQTCIDVADRKMVKFLEELRVNNKRPKRRPSSQIRISDTIENHVEKSPTKVVRVDMKTDQIRDDDKQKSSIPQKQQQASEQPTTDEDAPWRRNNSARLRILAESPTKNQVPDNDIVKTNPPQSPESNDVILRRTRSFENDKKSQLTSSPAKTTTTSSSSDTGGTPTTTQITATPASITPPIRRSFVPPVRDEESETQRKAHAKRVRETRRSTQGVTLDEIKSAEELVKKKNLGLNNNNNNSNGCSFKLEDASPGTTTFPSSNSTIIPSAPAVIAAANLSLVSQRRLNPAPAPTNSFSQGISSTANRPTSAPPIGLSNTTPNNVDSSYKPYYNVQKLIGSSNSPTTIQSNETTVSSIAAETIKNADEEQDNDKENDNRSAFAAAAIQRRRKPKRRSTGVVHLDLDDIDPDRHDSANDIDEKESGSERAARSRLGSASTKASPATSSASEGNKTSDKAESNEAIDYKALWEAAKLENDKLKQQLKKKEEEIIQSRTTLERQTNATTKISLSEIEKRERRALERKLSELEEELKLLQKLKTENERLRAENRALTRVVSKLTTSAQNQLSKSK